MHRNLLSAAHVMYYEQPGGPGPTPPAPPAPTPTPPAPPAPTPPAPPAPAPTSGGGDDLVDKISKDPAAAAAELKKLREENANSRIKNKNEQKSFQDAMRAMAKAAGIELKDDEPADPAELQKMLATSQAQVRNAEIRATVTEIAGEKGLKVGLTRAVLQDRGILDGLDYADKDFRSKLETAIDKVVQETPELKVGRAPTRSGGQFNGGGSPDPSGDQDDKKSPMERLRGGYPTAAPADN